MWINKRNGIDVTSLCPRGLTQQARRSFHRELHAVRASLRSQWEQRKTTRFSDRIPSGCLLYNKLRPSLQHFGGLIWRQLQKVGGPGLVPERASACGAAAAPTVPLLPLRSVDRGHLVQAVLLGFEPQVGDAVGHVHALGRVGVGAGGRVGGHGAARREEGGGERVTSPAADSELKLSVSRSCRNMNTGRRRRARRTCDVKTP